MTLGLSLIPLSLSGRRPVRRTCKYVRVSLWRDRLERAMWYVGENCVTGMKFEKSGFYISGGQASAHLFLMIFLSFFGIFILCCFIE